MYIDNNGDTCKNRFQSLSSGGGLPLCDSDACDTLVQVISPIQEEKFTTEAQSQLVDSATTTVPRKLLMRKTWVVRQRTRSTSSSMKCPDTYSIILAAWGTPNV